MRMGAPGRLRTPDAGGRRASAGGGWDRAGGGSSGCVGPDGYAGPSGCAGLTGARDQDGCAGPSGCPGRAVPGTERIRRAERVPGSYGGAGLNGWWGRAGLADGGVQEEFGDFAGAGGGGGVAFLGGGRA